MLPPGHLAAGYLTTKAVLHFAHPQVSAAQTHSLVVWGTLFGFIPDLDIFWYFFQNKNFLAVGNTENNHRKYISHAPLVWMLAGLLIYFFSSNIYYELIGLLLWLGSWSHFILDSIDYGIMWLWPFSSKIYALKNAATVFPVKERGFIKHHWEFFKLYSRALSFYVEIFIVIIALIIHFK